MLIDKGGDVDPNKDGGGDNGSEAKADSEIDQAIHAEGGDADSDGGAEVGEAEESDSEEGSEAGEVEESGDEVAETSEVIKGLQTKIAELEQKLSQPPAPPPTAPKELSEEDWAKLESEWGSPRTTIDKTTRMVMNVHQNIKDYVDAKFAKYEINEAKSSLASDPEYSDANKYSAEIDEYLNKVDPRYRTNPTVLRDAVIWARGKNMKGAISKVRDEKDRNKKIAGVARPSAPSTGKPKTGGGITELQHRLAAASGMTDEEYMDAKKSVGVRYS